MRQEVSSALEGSVLYRLRNEDPLWVVNAMSSPGNDPGEVERIRAEARRRGTRLAHAVDAAIHRESRIGWAEHRGRALLLARLFDLPADRYPESLREDMEESSETGGREMRAALAGMLRQGEVETALAWGRQMGVPEAELARLFLAEAPGMLADKKQWNAAAHFFQTLRQVPLPLEAFQDAALRRAAVEAASQTTESFWRLDPVFAFTPEERDRMVDGWLSQFPQQPLRDFISQSLMTSPGGELPPEIRRLEELQKHHWDRQAAPGFTLRDIRVLRDERRMGQEAFFADLLERGSAKDVHRAVSLVSPAERIFEAPEFRARWKKFLARTLSSEGSEAAYDAAKAALRWGGRLEDALEDPEVQRAMARAIENWADSVAWVDAEKAEEGFFALPSYVNDARRRLGEMFREDPDGDGRRSSWEHRRKRILEIILRSIEETGVAPQDQADWYAVLPLSEAEKVSWRREIRDALQDAYVQAWNDEERQGVLRAMHQIGEGALATERFAWAKTGLLDRRILGSQEVAAGLFLYPQDALEARATHQISPEDYLFLQETDPEALKRDAHSHIDAARILQGIERRLRLPGGWQWRSREEDGTSGAVHTLQQERGHGHLAPEASFVPDLLERGIARFGAGAVLRYLNRPDLSIHDGVVAWEGLFACLDRWGVDGVAFGANVLEQVARDNASYPEGDAHRHFASVVGELARADIPDFLRGMEDYLVTFPDPAVQAYVDAVRARPETVVASWKRLKKFGELHRLLRQKELLGRLAQDGDARRRAYIDKLLFHPDISTEAVKQLYADPDTFFATPDPHGQTIAPSDWCRFSHLGLEPKDLRDALIGRGGERESALDRAQLIPPFEAEYRLGPDPYDLSDPAVLQRSLIVEGIGKLREKKPGRARNPKKLLTEAQRLLGLVRSADVFPPAEFPEKDSAKRFFALAKAETGVALLERLRAADAGIYAALQQLVVHPEFGMEIQDGRPRYRARVWRKSDPAGAIAGNDTACCMPFGSGKKIHYDMSPGCAQLTVERLVEDGEGTRWRTAAQSVLTLDRETEVPFAVAADAVRGGPEGVDKLGGMEVLDGPLVLVADNIETAKNELGTRVPELEQVYRRFADDYLRAHAAGMGVDPTRLVVGKGYTLAAFQFDEVPNRFVPAIPVSYTDNHAETAFEIRTGLSAGERRARRGVSPMAPTDVFAVASIEKKAFADIPYMIEGTHQVQQKIQAVRVAAELRSSPNLSFVYRDRAGIPRGYVVAYEGRSSLDPEQRFVYIDDMAADPQARIVAGAQVIQAFLEGFFDAYARDGAVPLPILTHARESTSFKVVQNQAVKRAAERGLVAVVEDAQGSAGGPDAFHELSIGFGRTEDEAREQAAAMRGPAASRQSRSGPPSALRSDAYAYNDWDESPASSEGWSDEDYPPELDGTGTDGW